MVVMYNYIPYEYPKNGLFGITSDIYKLPGGWVLVPEQYLIIGEDDHSFIYKIVKSGHGEWIGNKVMQLEYYLPIGLHKSRLIKWLPTQTILF